MFALAFRFPFGRYHATPWGRHVNEGAVAWPPEPYRVLRALIATWHRKADRERWDEPALHRLIETLAASAPAYRLPAAVHSHTRHYMPQESDKTVLILDAFYRIDPEEELVMAWPAVTLDAEDLALAAHLAGLLGYLGRAESVVIARATDAVEGPFPVEQRRADEAGWTNTEVLAPVSAEDYAVKRPTYLAQNQDKPRSKARAAFEATVPPRLTDALQVETSQLQAAGWSRPPAGRLLSYAHPEVGPRPASPKRRQTGMDDHGRFQVARFVLAGRPLPLITDAVKIGEIFRLALMSRAAEPVPAVLSGRDESGNPMRDPRHSHAFFLPEDHDKDGFIDHLVLYARSGLDRSVRRAAEALRALWIEGSRRRRDDSEVEEEGGRQEWRVALEGFGTAEQFNDSSLLRSSRTWVSITPYLRPRHMKGGEILGETREMLGTECERRGWPLPQVESDGAGPTAGRIIRIEGQSRNVLDFHRFRSRRGLAQPDRTGLALRLEFPVPIQGPVALGFACHFGLGMFRADNSDNASV